MTVIGAILTWLLAALLVNLLVGAFIRRGQQ